MIGAKPAWPATMTLVKGGRYASCVWVGLRGPLHTPPCLPAYAFFASAFQPTQPNACRAFVKWGKDEADDSEI